MKKAFWLDCDGTISDVTWRQHHVQGGNNNWPAFFAGIADDPVFKHVEAVVRALHTAGWAVIVVTARPDENGYREATLNWFKKHDIPMDAIYMRKGGDYRKDSIVKQELLDQIYRDGYDIQFALDDRDQVITMLRDYGIPVLQVNPGDFDNRKQVSKYQGQILLHMMVGISGVGKDTYIAKHFKLDQVVSTDAIRLEMFGSLEDPICYLPENMNRTFNYAHALTKARLEAGLVTVFNATNLKRKDRLEVLKLLPKGVLGQYIVLCRNYDDVLKTKGNRSEKLINKHYNTFKQNLNDILKGDAQPSVIVKDMREWKP